MNNSHIAGSDLTDAQWAVLEPLLPRRAPSAHGSRHSLRTLIDGIRYHAATEIHWKDLPARYGPWNTVYGLLWRWRQNGTWRRIRTALPREVDPTELITWDVDRRMWWSDRE